MTVPVTWKKSSFTAQEANCVEMAWLGAVRDSKHRTGPTIPVDVRSLVAAVKTGQFDR